jgi:hypothetical protein
MVSSHAKRLQGVPVSAMGVLSEELQLSHAIGNGVDGVLDRPQCRAALLAQRLIFNAWVHLYTLRLATLCLASGLFIADLGATGRAARGWGGAGIAARLAVTEACAPSRSSSAAGRSRTTWRLP